MLPLSRRALYPCALVTVLAAWLVAMTAAGKWGIFDQLWPASLTMAFGSFVAGSTPVGGGAVAFPVFTKALAIEPAEARTFSLMIQSVGMTMASIFIFGHRIRIYGRVLAIAVPFGMAGHALGTFAPALPYPYPRLLFTMVALVFGVSLFSSHWLLRWHPSPIDAPFRPRRAESTHIALAAALGGGIATTTGSGVDVLIFIVMALAFGLHEKRAIPTSVIAMTAVSLFGFALRGTTGRIEPPVWDYWLACAPIVAVGAPLGAYAAARLGRDALIGGLLLLIAVDFATTLWLIPLDGTSRTFMAASAAVAAAYLAGVFALRTKQRRRRGDDREGLTR